MPLNMYGLFRSDVSGNGLESIPSTIGDLGEMRELDLSHNLLNSLPDSIGSLPELEELDVSHNLLQSLPAKLGGLGLTKPRPH